MTDTRTPEQIRKEWAEALRSGKYKQGKGMLRDECGGMCCLGVLHKIITRKAPPIGRGVPGKAIMKKAGLADESGEAFLVFWNNFRSLVMANDEGATFAEIADIIDSKPPGMFTD
jgi:hypothetical protein